MDGIPLDFFVSIAQMEEVKTCLRDMFNLVLESKKCPEEWGVRVFSARFLKEKGRDRKHQITEALRSCR